MEKFKRVSAKKRIPMEFKVLTYKDMVHMVRKALEGSFYDENPYVGYITKDFEGNLFFELNKEMAIESYVKMIIDRVYKENNGVGIEDDIDYDNEYVDWESISLWNDTKVGNSYLNNFLARCNRYDTRPNKGGCCLFGVINGDRFYNAKDKSFSSYIVDVI